MSGCNKFAEMICYNEKYDMYIIPQALDEHMEQCPTCQRYQELLRQKMVPRNACLNPNDIFTDLKKKLGLNE
jgi:hypothetical protein